MKVVTTDQMRTLEQRAIDAGVPEEALMENAGLGVARSIAQRIDGVRGKRVVVLVGPGNNGGDGMVASRYLADWGAVVTLYMTTSRRREDKFEECRERRLRVIEARDDLEHWQLGSYVSLADVVLDAVLGIGARSGLESNLLSVFDAIGQMKAQDHNPLFIALDVPTGLDADTGFCDEKCFPAAITYALGAPKMGLLQFPGAACVGELHTVPIGLPEGVEGDIGVDLADAPMVTSLMPERHRDGHKGSFGNVLVVGGSRHFIGAPILAAQSAYRSGAGLVTLASPESVYKVAAARLLEQVHLPLTETKTGGLSNAASQAARTAIELASAAVVGPGLGTTQSTIMFLRSLLLAAPAIGTPTVIDADALNILSSCYGWESQLSVPAVLTPHPGEMSKLLGRSVDALQANRVSTAIEAAELWQQVIVFKGAHTVIASPDGRVAISPFAVPALATAGTGDVLAGIIGGLLAQGLGRFEAAVGGVYVHGAAAEKWQAEHGTSGLLAGDLADYLPIAMQELRHGSQSFRDREIPRL